MTRPARLRRRVVSLAVIAALVAPAAPADAAPQPPAAPGVNDLSSKVNVKVTHNTDRGPVTTMKEMDGVTQLSAKMGSSDLQSWYNNSPEWAQGILAVLFVAVALDAIGTLVGPVRSLIFNAVRDAHLPLPVPPRP